MDIYYCAIYQRLPRHSVSLSLVVHCDYSSLTRERPSSILIFASLKLLSSFDDASALYCGCSVLLTAKLAFVFHCLMTIIITAMYGHFVS